MGILGKGKKKKETKEAVEEETKEKKTKKIKIESEGSRWTALILLVVTLFLGLLFYMQGEGWSLTGLIDGGGIELGGESTIILD